VPAESASASNKIKGFLGAAQQVQQHGVHFASLKRTNLQSFKLSYCTSEVRGPLRCAQEADLGTECFQLFLRFIHQFALVKEIRKFSIISL
jgi:hypothetical protein